MASLLRKGNTVVLTSGYLASVFEIGKNEHIDLIDKQHNLKRCKNPAYSDATQNGKKTEPKGENEVGDYFTESQNVSKSEITSTQSVPIHSCDMLTHTAETLEIPHIVSTDISQCGQYVAMVSSEKNLLVWNSKNWELMNVRNIARKPSRVRFTPVSNKVLVTDKSGSLYSFSLHDDGSNGNLILAHLSMLLDVIVTPHERFLITCDRDEKIRVSYMTAPYSIQSFCQGHLEFVSSISLLPSNQSILLSGSGDGTVRFWNYYDGTELDVLRCHSKHGEGSCAMDSQAVKSFSLQNISDKDVLCVCLSAFPGSLVYEIQEQNMKVDIKLIQRITYAAEPLCLMLDSLSIIWSMVTLDTHSVQVECTGLRTRINDEVKLTLSKINEQKGFLSESLYVPSMISQLFKKKYEMQGANKEGSGSASVSGPPPKKAKHLCDMQGPT